MIVPTCFEAAVARFTGGPGFIAVWAPEALVGDGHADGRHRFIEFLRSPAGQTIFARHGFFPGVSP